MNPYETPKIASDGGGSPLKRFMPPRIVILSMAGIALTLSLCIAKILYLAYQRGTFFLEALSPLIKFLIGISILTGIIYLLLRGYIVGQKLHFGS
jgi:hypothetical protein